MRPSHDGGDFLAIRPRGTLRWQLPKGRIDRGETSEQTALREVREEGGVEARALEPLQSIRYFFQHRGQRIVKTVDFYLMHFVAGDPADHDQEVDDARWISLSELHQLSFEDERKVVQKAVERLGEASMGESRGDFGPVQNRAE